MKYKHYNKESKIKDLIIRSFNKVFTCIIFSLIVLFLCNINSDFKEFVIDKVLNDTMDFSYINKFSNKITNVFKNSNTKEVFKVNDECSSYLDGVKCDGENIYLKDSGIVTYIGEKDGYGNSVVVQQSNGYYALYGNITPSIKIYDYVESGTLLGTTTSSYYYVLYKDDKAIKLDEY